MFKIGQKVRVKQWFDMPQKIRNVYLISPTLFVGEDVIICKLTTELGERAYEVDFISKEEEGYLFFEKELEPFIKVGEQLMLFEL